jgi:hypothetical protein
MTAVNGWRIFMSMCSIHLSSIHQLHVTFSLSLVLWLVKFGKVVEEWSYQVLEQLKKISTHLNSTYVLVMLFEIIKNTTKPSIFYRPVCSYWYQTIAVTQWVEIQFNEDWHGWISSLYMYFYAFFVWIPFYLQAVQIHSANGVKLLEAWRGVLSSTPPYK